MTRFRNLTSAIICLLISIAASAQGPFSLQAALSGEVGGTFPAFVSLSNTGTTSAANLIVTSVSFGTAALTSPVLPVSIGSLSPANHYVLDLRFDAADLVVGSVYELVVRGTYQVDSQTLDFAATQLITVTIPSGSMQVELKRWIALDDVNVQFASLPGIDRVSDAQMMLAFLQSRPEFVDSGVFGDSSSIWARFSDGQAIIISQDRDIPLPGGPAPAGVGNPSPLLPRTAVGEMPATIEPVSPPQPAPAASGPPPDLPASSTARILNTLGPGYGGADLVSDIRAWLTSWNYSASASTDASVDALKTVGGEGIFYINSHGGFVGQGTAGDPSIYAVWTNTVADAVNDILYNDDLTVLPPLAPRPGLVRMIGRKASDSTGRKSNELHYAFTDRFVSKYWRRFSDNSFVYFDICNSGSGSATADFQNAIFDKGASVFAGWTFEVDYTFAADTTRLIFDRFLGSNTFTGPAVSVGTQVLESAITGFDQRPFDWASVFSVDFARHRLGAVDLLTFLNFIPNPASSATSFGLLAPSIIWAQPIETQSQGSPYPAGTLRLVGTFGSNVPADPDSKVTVGGQDCPVQSDGWKPDVIACDLPHGAAGDVVVTVRKHESNKARLTKWAGTFHYTVLGDDSLRIDATYHATWRGDIRKVRPAIHDAPIDPLFRVGVLAADESSASYVCSGTATQSLFSITETITWTGGGNLPASRVSPPEPNTFEMIVDNTTGPNVKITALVGGTAPDAYPGCDWIDEVTFPDGTTFTQRGRAAVTPPVFDIGPMAIEPNDPSFPASFRIFSNVTDVFCGGPPTPSGTVQCRVEWDDIRAASPPDSRSAR